MKKLTGFFLAISIIISILLPYPCYANTDNSVIRVCYYPLENSLGKIEEHLYHGYYFDYLQELSQYTGWTYEFIDADYETAMHLLSLGEIDLICGIDKTTERNALLDYSNAPVMTAKYKFFTSVDNDTIFYNDYAYFDGLSVGVLKNCGQLAAIDALCSSQNITLTKIYFDTAADMETALLNGEIDLLYAINVSSNSPFKIVTHFTNTQLYFATAKGNPLMTELIAAQKNISNLFSYFEYRLFQENIEIYQDYYPFFTREELEYIKEHPVISFTSDPDWQPLEYTDPKTGKARGISVEILQLLEAYTGLTFSYQPAATFSEALEKIQNGEAELLTCLSHDYAWAEKNNVYLSTSYLDSHIVQIYNSSKTIAPDSVALPRGFRITERIAESGEYETILYYDTTAECLEAVANGTAYCTYTNNCIANYYLSNLAYRNLNAAKVSRISENISFAVSRNADLRLLSIMDKALRCIPTETIDGIVLENSLYETELSLHTLIYGYPELVLLITVIFFMVIFAILTVLLLLHRHKVHMIEMISQTDALTGILNRGAVQTKITMTLEKEKQNPELACPLILVDLDNFKHVNDTYGHMEGDLLLKAIANALSSSVRKTDIVGRLGGDEFIIYLVNVNDKKTAAKIAAKLCDAIHSLSHEKKEWEKITASVGLAFGDKNINWDILYRHADHALYTAKGNGKNQYSIYKNAAE